MEDYEIRIRELETAKATLEEDMSRMLLRIEDIGWTKTIGSQSDYGPELEDLKTVSETLRDMVATHPLMERGVNLRHAYVYGRGIQYTNLKPKTKRFMEKYVNRECLFSTQATLSKVSARATDGNVFTLLDTLTGTVIRIPMNEISAYMTNPDSAEQLWYIKRTWTRRQTPTQKAEPYSVWYKVSDFDGPYLSIIDGVTVADPKRYTMFVERFNRQVGWTWGVPDFLPAMSWAIGYSEYLNNNAKLVEAFAAIAYVVKTKTRNGAKNVGAGIASAKSVAATASIGLDQELSAMPRSGSEVSFSNGRPMASMIASCMGISVIALLSDPGTGGGSYGTAQTLDFPTIRVMSAVQEMESGFQEQLLTFMGSKDIEVGFPAIETDAVYRQVSSITLAKEAGLLWREEARSAILDIMDISDIKEGLPPEVIVDNQNAGNKSTSSQGVKGAVKGGMNFDGNDQRDNGDYQ